MVTTQDVKAILSNNTGTIALGAGAAVLSGGLVAAALINKSKKRKARKRKAVRKKSSTSKRRRRQKKPYTAGKRRDTSTRRIRYTKNNQPYVIMASGKARFIKKSSVSRSRKLKGGRY